MEDVTRTIEAGGAGERLDRFLASLGGDASRSEIQRQIRDGRVSVNGAAVVQPAYRLRTGEQVCWRPAPDDALVPRELPLRVLYEDGTLLAIDKPAGLVVHPGAGTKDTTLVEALLAGRSLPASDDPVRPGIVHRLDKETSGVIIVAKTLEALDSLKRQFALRTVEKLYLAVVEGALEEDEGWIDAPIGRDPAHPRRMSVRADGRSAQTAFRVLSRERDATFVVVRTHTGRTHQIRVHFQYIGHPVEGDVLYGARPAPRLVLHAWRLTVHHPKTGEPMTFEATPVGFPAFNYATVRWSDRAATA